MNLGDGAGHLPPLLVEAHNQVRVEKKLGEFVRIQPPTAQRLQDYYKGNVNIADSDGPLALHRVPHGNTLW